MVARLAITTALALAGAACGLTNHDFNISISDNSPMLVYTPAVGQPDANLDASVAWNVSYSNTPWTNGTAPTNATASNATDATASNATDATASNATSSTIILPINATANITANPVANSSSGVQAYQPGIIGNGTSTHTTSVAGATVEITWIGTAIYFKGNGSAELTVDGVASTASIEDGIIAYGAGLTYGSHKAVLTVGSDTTVTITDVVLTWAIATDAATAAESPTWDILAVLDGELNTYIANGDGRWSMHEPLGSAEQIDYPRMDSNYKSAYAFFQAPANSTFMTLWGSMGSDHGNFSIEINPPGPDGSRYNFLDGYSPWTTPDTLLFAAPLDPTEQPYITMKIVDSAWMDFHHATFYNSDWGYDNAISKADAAKKAAEKKGISTGAIAGIAIAATVGGLAIIGAIIFFCLRKRRRTSRHLDDKFDVLDVSNNISQFVDQTNAYGNGNSSQYYVSRHGLAPTSATTTDYFSPVGMVPGANNSQGALDLKAQILATSSSRNGGIPHHSADGVSYVTDTDAGPAERVQLMPPSYNPDWVETSSSSSQTADGSSSLSPLQHHEPTNQRSRRSSIHKAPYATN